jgi:hypothetical protein
MVSSTTTNFITGGPLDKHFSYPFWTGGPGWNCEDFSTNDYFSDIAFAYEYSTDLDSWLDQTSAADYLRCSAVLPYLCLCQADLNITDYTNIPTKSPIQKPTHNPTIIQSHLPTHNPTKNPSKKPSRSPSNKPTINPSLSPIELLTALPTTSPTDSNLLNQNNVIIYVCSTIGFILLLILCAFFQPWVICYYTISKTPTINYVDAYEYNNNSRYLQDNYYMPIIPILVVTILLSSCCCACMLSMLESDNNTILIVRNNSTSQTTPNTNQLTETPIN